MTLSVNTKNITKRYVEAGCTLPQLCELFGVPLTTMRARLKRMGLKAVRSPHPKGRTHQNGAEERLQRDKELCENFLKHKWTLKQCGQHYGFTRERARQILKANGINERMRWTLKNSGALDAFRAAYLRGDSTEELTEYFELSQEIVWSRIGALKCTKEEKDIRRKNQFWRLVAVTQKENECWLWTGGKHPVSGYGMWTKGRRRYAHRTSYEFFYKQKPKLHVLHKKECPNKHCVNPHHLYEGTHQQNVRDRDEAYRNGKPRKPLIRTPKQIVYLVRHFKAEGKTNAWISRTLKLDYGVVTNIVTGKTHKDVVYP